MKRLVLVCLTVIILLVSEPLGSSSLHISTTYKDAIFNCSFASAKLTKLGLDPRGAAMTGVYKNRFKFNVKCKGVPFCE